MENYATITKLKTQGYNVSKAYGLDFGKYYCFKYDSDLQEYLLDTEIPSSKTECEAWERLILNLKKEAIQC